MWPWSPETQVTFSLHGLFPHSRLSPLPASRADYILKLLSICHPIWCVHRPREENQHRREDVASSRPPSEGESHLPQQFTLNLNAPAVAHVLLVQNPSGLTPQSRKAQEAISSQGIPMGLSRSITIYTCRLAGRTTHCDVRSAPGEGSGPQQMFLA